MTTLVSLLFITMTAKLQNFPYTCVFKVHHNYFLACAQLLFSGKSVSQYASYSLYFSPLNNILNGEQHEKYLYNQSSHYGNTECFMFKVHTTFINLKVGVLLDLYYYALFTFSLCWATFQVKNNVRSTLTFTVP